MNSFAVIGVHEHRQSMHSDQLSLSSRGRHFKRKEKKKNQKYCASIVLLLVPFALHERPKIHAFNEIHLWNDRNGTENVLDLGKCLIGKINLIHAMDYIWATNKTR